MLQNALVVQREAQKQSAVKSYLLQWWAEQVAAAVGVAAAAAVEDQNKVAVAGAKVG